MMRGLGMGCMVFFGVMEMLTHEGADLIFISWNTGIDFLTIKNGLSVEIPGLKARSI